MQAAERGDPFRAGAKHQVVGVAEQNVSTGGADRFRGEPFDGGLRPDRHEGRRANAAVRRDELAATRNAVGRDQLEREFHQTSWVTEMTFICVSY